MGLGVAGELAVCSRVVSPSAVCGGFTAAGVVGRVEAGDEPKKGVGLGVGVAVKEEWRMPDMRAKFWR